MMYRRGDVCLRTRCPVSSFAVFVVVVVVVFVCGIFPPPLPCHPTPLPSLSVPSFCHAHGAIVGSASAVVLLGLAGTVNDFFRSSSRTFPFFKSVLDAFSLWPKVTRPEEVTGIWRMDDRDEADGMSYEP